MKKLWIIGLALVVSMSCKERSKAETNNEPLEAKIETFLSFKSGGDQKTSKKIVLVSGDEEYRSEELLPQLAKILSQKHGFDCMVLFAQDSTKPGIVNPNHRFNIPGLEQLNKADLVIWFTRFRELPEKQMRYVEEYLLQGKPLIGIRTATHAFNFEDKTHPFVHYGWNYEGDNEAWKWGFGKQILGETWYVHHGNHKQQSTRGIFAESAKDHPILTGIEDGALWGPTDVYGVRTPISDDAEILVYGKSIERAGSFDEADVLYGMRETDSLAAKVSGSNNKTYDPNENMPPIVWLNSYQLKSGKKGKALTSTLGAATDFLDEDVRRLFVNSVYYMLGKEPPQNADVDIVGEYNPTQYGFHDDAYWETKNLLVKDLK
ncbi:ThuA domain-containing protein [Muricauda sp. CAU 1633]|uniref:ThuA domain-containing protein n=1 Tax=Allomuricauda sp. CAU 1633 TaxID=2816036 RepID=UPI001A8DD811|nr:ThuA domain-containing protein [Muricauda sp. CAU 1633]MBO0323678.1 ThuA domain-containing protein [Muricauda sp. CAU 1633]